MDRIDGERQITNEHKNQRKYHRGQRYRLQGYLQRQIVGKKNYGGWYANFPQLQKNVYLYPKR